MALSPPDFIPPQAAAEAQQLASHMSGLLVAHRGVSKGGNAASYEGVMDNDNAGEGWTHG